MGEGFLFGVSPYSLPLFPLGRCAFALLAIVRLLCWLGNVIIADAQSKRLCWPYKRRLIYQVMGSGQDGVAHENQVSDQTGQDSPTDRREPARRSQPPTTPVSPPPFHWRGTGAGEIPPLK